MWRCIMLTYWPLAPVQPGQVLPLKVLPAVPSDPDNDCEDKNKSVANNGRGQINLFGTDLAPSLMPSVIGAEWDGENSIDTKTKKNSGSWIERIEFIETLEYIHFR